jgi:hypothetical protein
LNKVDAFVLTRAPIARPSFSSPLRIILEPGVVHSMQY